MLTSVFNESYAEGVNKSLLLPNSRKYGKLLRKNILPYQAAFKCYY